MRGYYEGSPRATFKSVIKMSLRKGKKAFKAGKNSYPSKGYQKYLIAKIAKRESALRILRVAISQAMAAVQASMIRAQAGIDPAKKSMQIAEVIINSASIASWLLKTNQ